MPHLPTHESLSVFLPALPAELFAIIASLIPLTQAPCTLLSLALVNHELQEKVLPLLYARLILKNESGALSVFRKILAEPERGLEVKELYILSSLSHASRKGEYAFDVVTGIRSIVEKGFLPRLSALGIYLTRNWNADKRVAYGRLPTEFWKDLRGHCPQLHTIILRKVRDTEDHPWLHRTIIDDMGLFAGLSTLSLDLREGPVMKPIQVKLLATISQLASSLERLALARLGERLNFSVITRFHFPQLKSIKLSEFSANRDGKEAMSFWRQHPRLEGISIIMGEGRWFSEEVDSSLLPNLRHLKAKFADVRILVPILHRIQSLSITESQNAQIPYLLREMIPKGLPSLKSLTAHLRDLRNIEGAMWYEKSDGSFHVAETRKEAERTVTNNFMHSIVRGAPNLVELAIHFVSPYLAKFPSLQRFYTRGFHLKKDQYPQLAKTADKVAEFLSVANTLATKCPRLGMVTSMSADVLPYLAAKIQRNSEGEVQLVRRVAGVGLQIPEDGLDPFPFNQNDS
ncbi:hypothetical protein HYPSUDRAFT_72088 [Hypholoma sublateritium FD-334 SS-4]|uniref:Uncharacterized protein n=1 Tax=Hypholoma sublateritium (strain FD-334 SS-4) TaxID=945553 RepID=A0A0D2KLB9_HYPSF|nr:hypothetical protein HYPSUDRAFT_72088 [Hypholoma sublateritium FD-334 SS-4]